MQEIRQPLNKEAFGLALKIRNISQLELADKIGANEKSFSRWINDGFIQSKYLWDLTEILDLSENELTKILMVPQYKVFFRKKYLGDVPSEIINQASALAKTLFGLTYLNSKSRFCPPNASKIDSSLEVANQIRKYTKIEAYSSLKAIISNLAEQGVEIAVVPFEKLGLSGTGEYEKAFSVTDEKRCLIFLDSDEPEESLIFNLCHELGHLFRPDLDFSKTEEKFCNAVSAELIYPKNYFADRKEVIDKSIQKNSEESIIHLLNTLKYELGGELWGLSIRLKELGFLSQKDVLHKKIFLYGESSFKLLPKIGDTLFSDFDPKNSNSFSKFWSKPEIEHNIFLRFFFHIKNGAIDNSISSRKFSELFHVDIGLSDEMFHKWKFELLRILNSALKST